MKSQRNFAVSSEYPTAALFTNTAKSGSNDVNSGEQATQLPAINLAIECRFLHSAAGEKAFTPSASSPNVQQQANNLPTMRGRAVNTADLYQLLEEKREIVVSCITDNDYYSLRTGIYRARKQFLEAFALIDDTTTEDGFQMLVRRDVEMEMVKLKLVEKAEVRQWKIIETPEHNIQQAPALKIVNGNGT